MRGARPRAETWTQRARDLRKRSTEAEKHLWAALRGHRLGGWKWRRQVPIGGYIVDFFCPAARVVVELDGGQHGVQTVYDFDRTQRLERLGLHVLRFWNPYVLTSRSDVCEVILAACGGEPLTQPSPRERGEVKGCASLRR